MRVRPARSGSDPGCADPAGVGAPESLTCMAAGSRGRSSPVARRCCGRVSGSIVRGALPCESDCCLVRGDCRARVCELRVHGQLFEHGRGCAPGGRCIHARAPDARQERGTALPRARRGAARGAAAPAGRRGLPAAARRLVATGVSLECGQTQGVHPACAASACVRYDDGSRVFLWRHDGRWFVVGFALR